MLAPSLRRHRGAVPALLIGGAIGVLFVLGLGRFLPPPSLPAAVEPEHVAAASPGPLLGTPAPAATPSQSALGLDSAGRDAALPEAPVPSEAAPAAEGALDP